MAHKRLGISILFTIFLIGIVSAGTPSIIINLHNVSQLVNDAGYIPYMGAIQNVDLGDYNVTADWFKGKFNWTEISKYLSFDGSTLDFSETELNSTIDLRTISNYYNASLISTISGTLDAGNLASIIFPEDEDTYDVSEDVGADPLTIIINFSNVDSFDSIIGRVYYDGGLGHEIQLEIQRSDTGAWENYLDLTDTTDYVNIYVPVFDPEQHVFGNGDVSIRFNHVQSGIPTHNFYIDYLTIVDGWTTLTVADHDALGGRDSKSNHPWALPTDGTRSLTGSWNFGAFNITGTGNITASYFFGNGSQLTGIATTETDPLWTANQSLYSLTSTILGWDYYNATDFNINNYYLKSNPFGFFNISDFSISDYYLKNNPFGFWNDTYATFNKTYADTLYLTSFEESDPLAYNGTLAYLSDILGWNYYNSTDFSIANYYLKNNPFGFYNSSDFSISDYVRRNTWTDIDNYPTGCDAGYAVRVIGDTLTCIAVGGVETDPYWTANQSLVYLKSNPFGFYNSSDFSITDYYLKNNPFGFFNSSAFSISDYYLKNNPFGFYNSTNPQTETDPLWSANSSAIARTGNCPAGQVVMNTTTSGVQCVVPPAGDEVDPLWTGNYTADQYLFNTGDTATGNYAFDTDTLFIDASANRVGIGTTDTVVNAGLTIYDPLCSNLVVKAGAVMTSVEASGEYGYGWIGTPTNLALKIGTSGEARMTILSSGEVSMTGTLDAPTINTGAGDMEVNTISAYLGNQNLRTTDKPQFAGVNLGGATYYLGSGASASKLYTLSINEIYGDIGSITDPSYTWTGDTNTGLYWVGADQMGVTLGGVMRASFKPNYFEVKPSTDSYGIIVRDSGGSSYANLQNINGVTHLKDNTGAGLQISGSAVSVPDHGTAATDMVINVAYTTTTCPAANTVTIGGLCIKYTA